MKFRRSLATVAAASVLAAGAVVPTASAVNVRVENDMCVSTPNAAERALKYPDRYGLYVTETRYSRTTNPAAIAGTEELIARMKRDRDSNNRELANPGISAQRRAFLVEENRNLNGLITALTAANKGARECFAGRNYESARDPQFNGTPSGGNAAPASGDLERAARQLSSQFNLPKVPGLDGAIRQADRALKQVGVAPVVVVTVLIAAVSVIVSMWKDGKFDQAAVALSSENADGENEMSAALSSDNPDTVDAAEEELSSALSSIGAAFVGEAQEQ